MIFIFMNHALFFSRSIISDNKGPILLFDLYSSECSNILTIYRTTSYIFSHLGLQKLTVKDLKPGNQRGLNTKSW